MRINSGKILNVIIIALSAFLVFLCIGFFSKYKKEGQYYYASEDTYLYYIADKDYLHIMSLKYYNSNQEKMSDTVAECIAVADYYKNASLFRAYEQTENSEKAQKHYEKMEENKKQMGELSYTAQEILQELDEIIGGDILN